MNSKVLNEHLKGVADAIREKKGTTDLINPQDFSAEIKSIESGGGSGEGDSNIEYFAYNKEVSTLIECAAFAQYIKAEVEGQTTFVTPFSMAMAEMMAASRAEVVAFGIDFNDRMVMKQGDMLQEYTILDSIMQNGVSREEIESLPRITKEEFYSLD